MPIYIAMLRGINVSGQKIIRMEQLRSSFEALGFKKVRTYVQSGNVVFTAMTDAARSLAKRIEARIADEFGFDVPVLLRTADELGAVVKGNPFLKDEAVDSSWLYVTFLSDAARGTAAKNLQTPAAPQERYHVRGREIYLCCPNGYGRTKLSNNAIEKKLGVGATTRNWKSVHALWAMAQH